MGSPMRWIEEAASGAQGLPCILVAAAPTIDARRRLLRAVVGAALGSDPVAIEIAHAEGEAPRLVVPPTGGLILSSAARAGIAALGVARYPMGVDVEEVTPHEPPWRVLHPDEVTQLRALPPPQRDEAFARLWSLKEAYLKATGRGLDREPASFAVRLGEGEDAVIDDPEGGAAWVAQTRLRAIGGRRVAVSVITPSG